MGETSYPIVSDEEVWSYSKVESFETCPYGFFLRYISGCRPIDKFFASYGTWMHTIIERFYTGDLSKDDMLPEFLINFESNVVGIRPNSNTVQKYIDGAIAYLKGFTPFQYDMVSAEEWFESNIDGMEFVGRIDYIGEKSGEMCIIDNKSGDLRPRSNRKKPTLKDRELDKRLRQLYLYSKPFKDEYGKFPDALCFNCFRTGVFIEEKFDADAYSEAISWMHSVIRSIEREKDFYPKPDYFYCKYICGMSEDCIYSQMQCE